MTLYSMTLIHPKLAQKENVGVHLITKSYFVYVARCHIQMIIYTFAVGDAIAVWIQMSLTIHLAVSKKKCVMIVAGCFYKSFATKVIKQRN